MTPMTTPTEQEIRAALEEHARPVGDRWVFNTHPGYDYSETQVLQLTKVNLMLGTTPNGSLGADMLHAIVERIAALEAKMTSEDAA